MSTRDWTAGAVVTTQLTDGNWYAARLLESPWVAFYDGSDPEPPDLAVVVTRPVLRILAVSRTFLRSWRTLAVLPLHRLEPPAATFTQNIADPADLKIIDRDGDVRPATYQECLGLEAAAVWEPAHIADMLLAHARGETDPWTQDLALIDPSSPAGDPGEGDPR